MILLAYLAIALAAIIGFVLIPSRRVLHILATAESAAALAATGVIAMTVPLPAADLGPGTGIFFADHLGVFLAAVSGIVFFFASLYAGGYTERLMETGELNPNNLRLFYSGLALLQVFVTLAFFANNLGVFWILAELTTVFSALLVAILAARENIDAALKYIFIVSAAMLFSFAGIIFLFETARSTLGEGTLAWTTLMEHASSLSPTLLFAAFVLLFIGFAAKSGIFPFHTWLPEAHSKAPSAVSAVLSGVLLNVGIYGIIRVFALVHQTAFAEKVSLLLIVAGLLSVGIAAFAMLYQKNLKKLIAFSSIENMGLLLIGIGVASPLAIFWAVVHMLAHSLTKASLFLSAGILHRQYRSHDPGADDRIVDVFDLQPSAAWGVIIGTLAIAGVPPFPIFFTKFFLLIQVATVSPWLLAATLLLILVAVAGMARFLIREFSARSGPGAPRPTRYVVPLGMRLSFVLLIVIIAVQGLWFPAAEVSVITDIVAELGFGGV